MTRDAARLVRFVVTHINKDGRRVMSHACQFRNTYETPEQAQAWIEASKLNNSTSVLNSVNSGHPESAEVRPVECWDMKDGSIGDPKTIWFD